MVLTDYFDDAECINLAHREDKWQLCEAEFDKHGLTVWMYPAVNGNDVEYFGDLKKGVIGCALSHRNIIRDAKEMGLDNVLILEDDVEFDPELNEKFTNWITEVPENWDMLYLGGNHNTKRHDNKISPHVLKLSKTQATHAYAVRHTVYDLILDRLNNIDKDVDVIYMDIQKQCNAYCFTPRLAWQRAGVSDIWNQHVDYNFLRDKDGCWI